MHEKDGLLFNFKLLFIVNKSISHTTVYFSKMHTLSIDMIKHFKRLDQKRHS